MGKNSHQSGQEMSPAQKWGFGGVLAGILISSAYVLYQGEGDYINGLFIKMNNYEETVTHLTLDQAKEMAASLAGGAGTVSFLLFGFTCLASTLVKPITSAKVGPTVNKDQIKTGGLSDFPAHMGASGLLCGTALMSLFNYLLLSGLEVSGQYSPPSATAALTL